MTKRSRQKRERENLARLERHNADRSRAAPVARGQRKPVEGMRRVGLPSIADQLDEIDPHVRGQASGFRRQHVPAPAPAPSNTGNTQIGAMIVMNSSDAVFSSNERVRAKAAPTFGRKSSKPGKSTRPSARIKLPADLVEAMGLELLESIDFEVDVTEDGILFRPAGTRPVVQLPSWAKNGRAAAAVAAVGGRK